MGFEEEGVQRKAYKRAHENHYVDEIMMARLLEPANGATTISGTADGDTDT